MKWLSCKFSNLRFSQITFMGKSKHSLLRSCSPSDKDTSLSMECQRPQSHRRKKPMLPTPGPIGVLAPTFPRISKDLSHFQRRTTDYTTRRDSMAQSQSCSTKSQTSRCSSIQYPQSTLLLTHTRVSSPFQKSNLVRPKNTTRFLQKSPKKSSGHLSSRRGSG